MLLSMPGWSYVQQWDLHLGHGTSHLPNNPCCDQNLAVRLTQSLSSLSLSLTIKDCIFFTAKAMQMVTLFGCPLDLAKAWGPGTGSSILPRRQLDVSPFPLLGEAASSFAVKSREAACAERIWSH